MKKIMILMLVLMVTAVMIASIAQAQRGTTGTGQASVQQGLTAAQRAQIEAIREQARKDAAAATTPAQRQEIMRKMQADIQAVISGNKPGQMGTKPPKEVNEPNQGKSCMQQIGLTEEQKAKIEQIVQEAKAAAQTAATPEEKIAIMEKMHESIMDVLTDEQQAELEMCRAEKMKQHPMIGNCMKQLNLSEEQKATIEAIRQQAMTAMETAADREAKMAIIEKMHEDVMNVLDPNQQMQLQQCREQAKAMLHKLMGKIECLKDLNLTPEQQTQIQTIKADAKKSLMDAKGREARLMILKKMKEDIKAVLTPDQLTQYEQCIMKQPQMMNPSMK